MMRATRHHLVWIVIYSQLMGCGESGGPETEPRLQDPISEMGDTFDVDIDSLPTLKSDASGPRVLVSPVEVIAPSAVRENSERAEAGVELARWELYATFDTAPPNSPPMEVDRVTSLPAEVEAEDRTGGGIVMGFPDTGRVYRVSRPVGDLETLKKFYVARGRHLPSGGEPRTADLSPVAKASFHSDGVDDRDPLGVFEFSETTWPYRTIAESKPNGTDPDVVGPYGSCTATFIGPQTDRHVITAAHCFWRSSGSYKDPDYVPRKDGCEAYPGWPLPDCEKAHYGQWDGWVWMMPQYFIDNCVPHSKYLDNFDACRKNDIAVQHVVAESTGTFPGAMGFGAYSDHQLANVFPVYHRGYPACLPGDRSPVDCRSSTLYGQPPGETCTLTGFSGRHFDHSCDASDGHSGGPLYLYDSGGVYVAAVHVGTDPLFLPDSTPKDGTRIDSQFYGWMLDFMNL